MIVIMYSVTVCHHHRHSLISCHHYVPQIQAVTLILFSFINYIFWRDVDWFIIEIGNLFDMNNWVVYKFYPKVRPESWANASFSPGVCGYMCPTRWAMCSRLWSFWCPSCCPGKCPWWSWRCWQRKKNFLPSRSRIRVTPRFFEYKVRLDNIYNFQNLCAQF